MKILVDGSLSWDEMYTEAAHEKHTSFFCNTSDLNVGNYPIVNKKKRFEDIRILPFKKSYSTYKKQTEEDLKILGFRSAYIEEVFAYAIQKPETQKKFKLIGLGSEWRSRKTGDILFPFLYVSFLGRYIGLTDLDRRLIEISTTKYLVVKI